MKPALKASATQQRDVKTLERIAPVGDVSIPPAAHMTVPELYEVERLANIGANLHQIGIHLRKPEDIWQAIVEHNPAVAEAYMQGYNRLQIEVMERIKIGAMTGEASLLRLYADRHLGAEWSPPKQGPAIVVQSPAAVRVDVVGSVRSSFDRQRKLIESEASESEAD